MQSVLWRSWTASCWISLPQAGWRKTQDRCSTTGVLMWKIPKMQMSGLGNYDRDGGFAKGAVTVTYETRRLTQDRGRTFQLDAMDVDEMNFAPTAGAVMREFQNTKVIPEIDAYRYSKIAELAQAAGKARAYTVEVETDF